VTKEVIHDIAKQLFHEVIDEVSRQLSSATVHAGRSLLLQAKYVCSELIAESLSRHVRYDPTPFCLRQLKSASHFCD